LFFQQLLGRPAGDIVYQWEIKLKKAMSACPEEDRAELQDLINQFENLRLALDETEAQQQEYESLQNFLDEVLELEVYMVEKPRGDRLERANIVLEAARSAVEDVEASNKNGRGRVPSVEKKSGK